MGGTSLTEEPTGEWVAATADRRVEEVDESRK